MVKNFKRMTGVILFVSIFSASHALADGNWLEKGVNLLKSLNAGDVTKNPSAEEIAKAFKEALHIGAANVVKKLGAIDGFNADPNIHIPLPEELTTVKTVCYYIAEEEAAIRKDPAKQTTALLKKVFGAK